MLTIELNDLRIDWKSIYRSAITTEGKLKVKEPSSKWKKKMLLAEHSPIRKGDIDATFKNIMSWVSVHLVRHKFGIEHFVKSQRTDRTGINRNELKQSEVVNHNIIVNLQSIIYISRKRCCFLASPETQQAWNLFLESFKELQPELYSVCKKDCVYRGYCYEMKSCGYYKTDAYKKELEDYRKI